MLWWEEWKIYIKSHCPGWISPLYEIMEREDPFEFERIDSLTVRQEKISSTGEVKETIPSNKESDLAQLSSKESKLIPEQGRMFELEWYKMICHQKGDAYYDSFKNQNEKDYGYSKNNLLRVTLNEFWDKIIGISNSPSLPSAFQSRNKWINVGTAYRKLVEPLDIADYYSTSKDSGNYLDKRPARYKVLEQWLEHRKTNRSSRDQRSRTKLPFLTRDSCFWARAEEALKDLKEGADQKKESLENFEKYVTEMIKDCKISSDVFLDRSSFMKWWRDYKEHQTSEWKLKSPLYNLKSPFWKS